VAAGPPFVVAPGCAASVILARNRAAGRGLDITRHIC
jgi:hypothetical protein